MHTSAVWFAFFRLVFLVQKGNSACSSSCIDPNAVPAGYTVKTYQQSSAHFINPGRGFVILIEDHSSSHNPLTTQRLDTLRRNQGISMVWIHYVLDTFVTSPISADFLSKIRHDLDVVHSSGFTVVLRFSYITEMRNNPPYGDASKSVVLNHISQLNPIFHQYEGIITTINAGFIGAWGEWHHSTSLDNANDRRDVLKALLAAAPKSVQVQLRTPHFKSEIFGSTTSSLAGVQAGQEVSRTGHHNDCFLASDDDMGTYLNKNVDYPYLERDTRYVIMGGETCSVTNNHRHECPTALRELAMFHWSWLNQAYNEQVLNTWKQQGCFEEVHRRLGYRLALTKAIVPSTARIGDTLCFHLELTNGGFAAPVKSMNLFLVLQSTTGAYYAAPVPGVEVRDWQPGSTILVQGAIQVQHVPEGTYKVFMALSNSLTGGRADYNVLFANNGVPVPSSGLNDLGLTVRVSGNHDSGTTCTPFSTWNPPASSSENRVFTGPFS